MTPRNKLPLARARINADSFSLYLLTIKLGELVLDGIEPMTYRFEQLGHHHQASIPKKNL